jgi:hypothetical protein
MSRKRIKGFVAYPSGPENLVEAIEDAVSKINGGDTVELQPWVSFSQSGRIIMRNVCQAIDKTKLFVCDLTYLNRNVLFELGYAIARNRRIWVLVNEGIARATSDYRAFRVVTTITYTSYANTHEIVDAFYRERPYERLEDTLFKDLRDIPGDRRIPPSLLYLKSPINTNESICLTRLLQSSAIPVRVDDPIEAADQPLSWYVQELANAYAVVVHLLSSDHEDSGLHNAKSSLVAGLAYGLGKRLLILAHAPYKQVVDYDELRRVHTTAKECGTYARAWLDVAVPDYRRHMKTLRSGEKERRSEAALRSLSIGDWQAEREAESLTRYFVPTAPFAEVMSAQQESLLVGEIGSGKTAIALQAASELAGSWRNHVCLVQPGEYEWDGLLRVLSGIEQISEQGFLAESLWKFLIYTELAKSLYEELVGEESRPHSAQELEFLRLVEDNSDLICGDFTLRLEAAVDRLEKVDRSSNLQQQRMRTSELLHSSLLRDLRKSLGLCLEDRERVAILVDNLDKGWTHHQDLRLLGRVLLAVIGLGHRIWLDFRKQDHWRRGVNLTLALFLRSDIFNEVLKHASEPHKLVPTRISWGDRDALLRVLESRLSFSLGRNLPRDELWDSLFCSEVDGTPTRDFLFNNILPRPRDLIWFARTAIAEAQNRAHSSVEEEDILSARMQYSLYALRQVIDEGSQTVASLSSIMACFLGAPAVVTRDFILDAAKESGASEEGADQIITLLVAMGFLGVEVESGRFEHALLRDRRDQWAAKASRLGRADPEKPICYRINDPFHPYLEVTA